MIQVAPIGIWLLYLAGAVGAVLVVTQSHITKKLRDLYPPLLGCPMCFGVWTGWGCGAALVARPYLGAMGAVLDAAACGGVVSLASFAVFMFLRKLSPGSFEHLPPRLCAPYSRIARFAGGRS